MQLIFRPWGYKKSSIQQDATTPWMLHKKIDEFSGRSSTSNLYSAPTSWKKQLYGCAMKCSDTRELKETKKSATI